MKNRLLLFVLSVVAFTSCTTLYKSGQTPDDVYYSPVRQYGEVTTQREERTDDYNNYNEDRQIRMGIGDPRWRYLDNDISYNPYMYGYNYGYYYNPYYYPLPVYNPVVVVTTPNPKVSTPRMVNLNTYGNGYVNTNTTVNPKTGIPVTMPVRSYNSGSRVGNVLRNIVTPQASRYNNSNSNSNNSQSNRTYTPAPARSSSSSTPASSGSVTRPVRSGVKN